ncbi:MAG: PD40 domain-containing protein [Candidatus Aminicenantes bacterium]|nr:PD40 domain-containing protein [Candidatus Aminicenantes bacterium]
MKKRSFTIQLIMIILLALPVWGGITLEPNGAITPGTTLTIRITLPPGARSAELQIVKDENGSGKVEEHEPCWLEWTPIRDNEKIGDFKDHCAKKRQIEIHLLLKDNVPAGKYVVRYRVKPRGLAPGAVLEITGPGSGIFSFFGKTLKAIIDGEAPTRDQVREYLERGRIDRANLFLMNGNTFEIISSLTDSGDCFSPCWSPGCRKIVYVRRVKDGDQLWLLTLEKDKVSEKIQLPVKVSGEVSQLLWSPDGKKILFRAKNTLRVVKVGKKKAAGKVEEILKDESLISVLTWTKDSRAIIFTKTPALETAMLGPAGKLQALSALEPTIENRRIVEIWQVDAGTKQRQRITYFASYRWLPYLSPDGTKLLFSIEKGIGSEIWLRRGDHFTEAVQVTYGGYLADPVYSPDGSRIVFVSNRKIGE